MCRRRRTAHLICMRIIFAHDAFCIRLSLTRASMPIICINKYTNRPPAMTTAAAQCVFACSNLLGSNGATGYIYALSLCLLCATDRFQSNRFWLIRCAALRFKCLLHANTIAYNQFAGCAPTQTNKSLFFFSLLFQASV